jgi:carboxylate-amine ligase
MEAEIIVRPDGHERLVTDEIAELVDELNPIARRLGCEKELNDALVILRVGASYQRQLAVAQANGGSLPAVVHMLAKELRHGLRVDA